MAFYTDIFIDQGATYTATIPVTTSVGTPFDLTNYSVRGQVRKDYTSSLYLDFTAVVTNATGGIITVSLTPAQTATLKKGRYKFDVEIYNVGATDVRRVSEGQLHINPRITQ